MAEARIAACEIGKRGIPALVVDAEAGFFRLGLAKELARAMRGVYLTLEQLEGNQMARIVRRLIGVRRLERL